jgi:methylmalonyl-CoA mutase N-terminal domain/subunit
MMRFHTQTGGVTLAAQQPLNNIVRVAYQAMSAVLGGTQSLHTNSYDEALALPAEQAATIALRTQQILSEETGVADTADPLAGSYFVESLTDELEARAQSWIDRVDELGGSVAAIERGWMQDAIAENAYQREIARDLGEEIVVGVNKYQEAGHTAVPIQRIDQEATKRQIARVTAYKATQNKEAVQATLDAVAETANGSGNLLLVMKDAFLAGATLGQVANALRSIFGEHRAQA